MPDNKIKIDEADIIKKYLSALGRKGGLSRSKAKQKSSRKNGKLGGRPKVKK
jgi:hypothetical protein